MTLALSLAALLSAPTHILPSWFPEEMFTLNPDNTTVEDFGTDSFKVATTGNDSDTVEVKGRHYAGSLYPPGPESGWDQWNGVAAFKTVRARLEKQGFKVVFLNAGDDGAHGTFRKGDTWVDLTLTNDAHSNSVAIVEPAAHARKLAFKEPAATPEKLSDSTDFPYVTPLAGAKLLNTRHDDGPMDVSKRDTEPQLVGTGTMSKMYEGPPNVSALDFSSTYESAFKDAGWNIVENTGGTVTAHYEKNGRDLWARVYQEGADRWDVVIADVGGSIKAALDKGCKVAVYGITFDFDKATLKPESEPVLAQVLAAMKSLKSSFEISGHTDNVGKPDYNLKLSQSRADSVKAWLVAHGISSDRLSTKGFGDKQPVVPNDSDAHRAQNRRVELKKPGC
jgi:OOP family OmpA-OmpF porin